MSKTVDEIVNDIINETPSDAWANATDLFTSSPDLFEISLHAISQLRYQYPGDYNVTYCKKEKDDCELIRLTARYTRELYMKWMDRFDYPFEWEIVQPRNLAQLVLFVYDGTITEKQAKEQVFPYMWENYTSPEWAILDLKILQNKNKFNLDDVINKLIADNPKQVEQFKSGNDKIVGFFMGRVMKETEGSFDPNHIKDALIKNLSQ